MKYLRFDYEGILRDYNDNKSALRSIKKQIDYFETGAGVQYGDMSYWDIIQNPDTLKAMHNQYDELSLYIALVDNALSSLQERERDSLKFYYIQGLTANECAEQMNISVREFFRIKPLAFDKFKHIIYWQ